jgi:hypothetical protein
VVILAFCILTHLQDDGEEFVSDSADGTVLFWEVGALVEIIWVRKDLLRFFKTDAAPRVLSQTPTLARGQKGSALMV